MPVNVWSGTSTLDGYLGGLRLTSDKGVAEAVLIGGKPIELDDFPRLRGIFKVGVGRDNVSLDDAQQRGIVCEFPSSTTSAIIYEETANFACHLILRCLYTETGDFQKWTKFARPALHLQRLLVVGSGNIGARVAAKMQSFLNISTYDVTTHRLGDLEPLMRRADCVSLHLPLTEQTRAFIDATKLKWLKNGASIINTARGAIVDEDALYQELSSGRLRAAFDVFWEEPYRGKLTSLPSDRFLVTPHVASTCREFLAAAAEDFRAFLRALEVADN